jgi:hypothetical protein
MNQQELSEAVKIRTQNKVGSVVIGLLVLLLISFGALCFFLYSNNKKLENQIAPVNNSNNTTSVNKVESAPTGTTNPLTGTIKPPTEPSLVVSDGQMIDYVNNKLKFSIQIPKTAANLYGSCTWVEDGDKSSYRPKLAFTPVKVFEDENSVYIAFEYSYELTGRSSADSHTYFKGCKKVENSIIKLQQERQTWNIISKQVKNDTELESFIKQRFGSACRLGGKTITDQPGVFSVKVIGDGKDLEFSQCILNYMFVIKYAPSIQRVFTFDRGQSFDFPKTLDYSAVYDDDMENSFKVLLP